MARVTCERTEHTATLNLSVNGQTRSTQATKGEIVTLTPSYERRDPDADGDGQPDSDGQTIFFVDL